MAQIELTVLGPPIPWTRAYAPKRGGSFLPDRQKQQLARFLSAWNDAGYEMIPPGTPVAIEGIFFVKRPQSHYGTGKNAGVLKPWAETLRPTTSPDTSNLLKLAEDALTGCAWMDDDQVVEEHAAKFYVAGAEDPPRSIVRVRVIDASITAAGVVAAVRPGQTALPVA